MLCLLKIIKSTVCNLRWKSGKIENEDSSSSQPCKKKQKRKNWKDGKRHPFKMLIVVFRIKLTHSASLSAAKLVKNVTSCPIL